jgi:DHA2 family multidrug resistance protein
MPFVGRTLGRGTDARWVIAAGLLTMAAGSYWMSQMNLDISPGQAVWPRVVLIVGLAMCFAPQTWRLTSIRRSRCAERRSAW